MERKLEGRGKKGRVFTGPEEFIHTHTRGRMQNRKWKKRVERERERGGIREGKERGRQKDRLESWHWTGPRELWVGNCVSRANGEPLGRKDEDE